MDLKEKVVLVTGSTRGIGAATALAFAAAGSRLILNGRSDLPAELKEQLDELGADYAFLAADLADPATVKQFAVDAWDQFGQVDVVVNNAGITDDKLLVGMKPADFDQVIDVNLRGPFLLTAALLKKMYKRRQGCFINLASVVGLHGNAGQANYAASKAGIVGLTKTTAREGALRGIRCNAIAPGMIKSAMTDKLSPRIQKQLVALIPLKRLGMTNEVAQTAIFLAQNDYVTGQTIVVDGGMTI
ncbi:SDR family oxidoreductase [Limosilactobacillus sp.]|jgi:3-oxoacyl-[acyl-carrier protein] reductase|uniref:SDR family oxidoreductase n=1 Tax=Limosilactobacillus sp. TaxID=2773925 RepID=UPI0025C06DD2|nr:SDR family oxidoreductase [Limosilactobacillus sp.]MCH3922881.1 SDR family oxidoreductase [Limosilactobacillus sp.]MCH3927564.1 SDR family oxidoreductase [Limosilactobacillus sp.]